MKAKSELHCLVSNLKELLPIANSHLVHFITRNSFERMIPKYLQDEIMSLDMNEMNQLVLSRFSNDGTIPRPTNSTTPHLISFLNDTQKLSLKHNSSCLSFEDLLKCIESKVDSGSSFHISKHLMSMKKSHEVEIMSAIVAAIAKGEKCTHIIDVGGGKGYLSSVLALKHELKVLSVDSSLVTSKGAERQMPKIEVETDVLFYRALLELYLEKKLGSANGTSQFKVGKLKRKCSSFNEYVHKSIERLGIHIQVDNDELQQLYDYHAEVSRKQLHAFFLLKLTIAPAIEAVIMLDRLLYLQEQGIQDAHLVQLFDPVVSPRCFSIVAFNRPKTNL
ncbi:probable methyltransferase-like protein 25 isoform X3 [Macrosteles quadrilineatus]|uniref:probable methyltransferase-like protein 25 isoform X3 n=1 Tax=Macrosteles quadrilineatus TaxID=74068 RepID=UPI0023E1E6E2|nr:probable methyltransferase-like protein 25 isoform X3 [Macrosteles quadrilineatus]